MWWRKNLSTFSETFSTRRKKTPNLVGNMVFLGVMSVGYTRDTAIQFHKIKEMWFLTYQMNICREVSFGFCWMFSTNWTIDFLIKSEGFVWN